MFLSKKSSSRPAGDDRRCEDRPDNVVYHSQRGGVSFNAQSPANSQHAAQLAKLAMTIQEKKSRKSVAQRPAGFMIENAPTYAQIQSTPQTAHDKSSLPGIANFDPSVVRHEHMAIDNSHVSSGYGYSHSVPTDITHVGSDQVTSHYRTTPPQVHRYITAEKTSYSLKTHDRYLYVSAPQDANEARFFDAVAAAKSDSLGVSYYQFPISGYELIDEARPTE